MRISLLKLLLAVAALLLSATVQALGMGGINVTSALGQPLQADIELVAVGKAERDSLVARLAQSEAYKSAGLEYPHGNKFKFQIETRANGEPYLQVSSEQPINDPFVSLLVEMTWPSGKLLREYTFLLDPPGYVPEQPVQSEVQVVAPTGQLEPAEVVAEPEGAAITGVMPGEQAMPVEAATAPGEQTAPTETITEGQPPSTEVLATPEGQTTPTEITAVPEEQAVPEAEVIPAERPAPAVEPLPTIAEWVAVPRGSTMYELAEQYKLADTSVERMLVAMYRANAGEFDGKNMNRIRAGKILRLPDDEELTSVTQFDAEREIRVQAADWHAYRQKLASAAAVSSQPQAFQQVAVGKISSSVIDKAPVAKESAKEVLKLSKGEAPGDQATAAGGKGMSEQDKKNAAQEEAIAKDKAAKEEQMRAAMLQKNLEDARLLEQLKAEKAALEAKASSAATPKEEAAPAAATTSAVKVESSVKPAAKPVVKPQPQVTEPEPTLVDQILAEPLYLLGGAVVLLGLGGLGFVLVRRKKKSSEEGDSFEDVGAITGRITAPVVPSPETGDFTRAAAPPTAAQAMSTQEPESVDPISEADLFLSFGRDGQAEEILKDALKSMPSNHQVHLKLLGIYASRQDVNSFGAIARQLQDSGDEYAWQQAVEMGRKLEPDNPMYGGSGSMEDTSSATVQMAAFNVAQPPVVDSTPAAQPSVLDFDFNLNAPQGAAAPSPEQDFIGNMEATTVLLSPGSVAEQVATMDFDVTSTHPMLGQAEAAPDEMMFDVTSSHSMPAAQPEAGKPAGDSDGGMAFTLDFPVEKAVEKSAPEPVSAGLAGISLNFDEAPASSEPSSGGKGEPWQEVATKLDLAKAYQEMGDADGAREILDEVMREGDAEQREAAQTLLSQLG